MERDKFLTEAMGLYPKYLMQDYRTQLDQNANPMPDFSTWQGFGKLWEWAQEQEWWREGHSGFMWFKDVWFCDKTEEASNLNPHYVHPDRFANAVYEFLKEQL